MLDCCNLHCIGSFHLCCNTWSRPGVSTLHSSSDPTSEMLGTRTTPLTRVLPSTELWNRIAFTSAWNLSISWWISIIFSFETRPFLLNLSGSQWDWWPRFQADLVPDLTMYELIVSSNTYLHLLLLSILHQKNCGMKAKTYKYSTTVKDDIINYCWLQKAAILIPNGKKIMGIWVCHL